jgi:hypothetical protein
MQGGIPRLAPPGPEPGLQSLPPILCDTCRIPIPSCSKGPRGLSVLPRVTSIFTRIAISPSPQLRQRPDRYAIRAGRNLPDKEFRSYVRRITRCDQRANDARTSTPNVAVGIGPSHPLFVKERAGVWSLRGQGLLPTSLLIFRTNRIVTPN